MACITTHGHSHTGCWWKFNLCQNTRHIPWSREPLLTMVHQATWGAEDNIMRTLRETTTTLGLMPSFRAEGANERNL